MPCRTTTLLVLTAAAALHWPASARGEVLQAVDATATLFGLSTPAEICVIQADRDRPSGEVARTCWPALGGQLTDLHPTSDGFLAAGHAAQEGLTELFVIAGSKSGISPLPVPRSRATRRGRPRFVIDDGSLLGLLWLEGATQDELVLRSARWIGDDWAEPETVSPRGPGSQVAPVVAALEDGRWLAMWTAFDGMDDETSWSLRSGAGWSAAERAHEDNRYPDTTPAAVATGSGALAAWSAFDGRDYRIRLARFDGRHWEDLDHDSGRGAVDPLLQRGEGSNLLSYSTVVPEQWVFVEISDDGVERRRISIASDNPYRPSLSWSESGVVATWHTPEPSEVSASWGDDR